MTPTGFGYPSNVLAKHIKLKLPINQRLLRALTARLDPFTVTIIA
jgi:hypothetical protein